MELLRCELYLCGSGYESVVGSCELGKEPVGSTTGRKFLDKLGAS